MNGISQLLIKHGIAAHLKRSQYICLSDESNFHFIKKGKVDLFAAKIIDRKPIGVRHKLFSISYGGFVFPLFSNLNISKYAFIAVPVGETELITLKTVNLNNIISNESDNIIKAFSLLIDSWINILSLSLRFESGTDNVKLLGKGKNTLKTGSMIKSKDQILWIKNPGFMILNDKEENYTSKDFFIPFSETVLFQVNKEIETDALSTAEIIKEEIFSASLANYDNISATILENWYLRLDEEELNLQKNKIAAENSVLRKACMKLGSIFAKEKIISIENDTNDVFSALATLGDFLNIKFIKHPEADNDSLGVDMKVRLISEASNIRSRRVSLDSKWYKKDSGPLLGFLKENSVPVAIIPKNNKSYFYYKPSNGNRVFIKEKEASLFEEFAYYFYRPLLADKVNLKTLFFFSFFGNKKSVVFVILIGILSAVFSLIMPLSTGIIFDHIIPEADRTQLFQISVIIFVCTLITALFSLVKTMTILSFSSRTCYALQTAVWDRLLALPVNFFRKYTAGDLAQRSLGISRIQGLMDSTVISTFLNTIFSIGFLLLLFYYSVSLALIGVAISLAFVIVSTILSWLILKYQKKLIGLEGEISGMVYQFISAISKIRMCGAENRILNNWAEKFYIKKSLSYKSGAISNISIVVNSFLPVVASIIIFAWVIYKTSKGDMSAGSFMAFNTAYISFQGSLLSLSSTFIQILSVLPVYQRIKPILETKPELNGVQVIPKKLTGRIEINDVSFRYSDDGEEVLKNVSMSVEPGSFVAIVGKSGSGKSTLMRLLLGFEKANKGTVYYDSYDISLLDKKELRRQLGVVLQNSSLVQGSIFDNIIGSLPLTLEDAWEAAKMAGCEKDISEMPMGLHTLITAGGGTISGGQKQRLMIARALVKKPGIIFFDEATSALDNKTQSIVSHTIEKLNVTRIVIAHRLSTIINADKIYVLDNGSVVQSGTYNELINEDGPFKELATRQII